MVRFKIDDAVVRKDKPAPRQTGRVVRLYRGDKSKGILPYADVLYADGRMDSPALADLLKIGTVFHGYGKTAPFLSEFFQGGGS